MATFSLLETVELDADVIRKAVSSLNFTPKELRVTIRGKLVRWSWPEDLEAKHAETTTLRIEATGQHFLLSDPPAQREEPETPLNRLLAQTEHGDQAVITGTVHQHTKGLPLGLIVEAYELAP